MAKNTRTQPGSIEAYPSPSGKLNFQVISGIPFDTVLMVTKQGYERKAGVAKARASLEHALATAGDIEYLTREEYLLRQQRRRRAAAKRRASRRRK